MKNINIWECAGTGAWLGVSQVMLGFTLMRVSGAGAWIFFAFIACWLGGSLAGLLIKRVSGFRRTMLFFAAAVAAQYAFLWACDLLLFLPHANALGLLVSTLSGCYAGIFFRDRSGKWQTVRPILLHENNGFLLGYVLGAAALFFSMRLVVALQVIALLVLVCAAFDDRANPYPPALVPDQT